MDRLTACYPLETTDVIPCEALIFKKIIFSTLNLNFRLFNVAKFTPDPCLFFQANQKRGTEFICSVLSGT